MVIGLLVAGILEGGLGGRGAFRELAWLWGWKGVEGGVSFMLCFGGVKVWSEWWFLEVFGWWGFNN